MSNWAFPADEKFPVAKCQVKKGEEWGSRIDFEDIHLIKDGDTIHCFGHVTGCDATQIKDKPVSFPSVMYWKVTATGGTCEKVVYEALNELDASKGYTGFVNINESLGLDYETLKMIQGKVCSLLAISDRKLDVDKLPTPPKSSGGKQYKTPAERLAERLQCLETLMAKPEPLTNAIDWIVSNTGQPLSNADWIALISSLL